MRLIDLGLKKSVKMSNLFSLPPPLANWPAAATLVRLLAPPGVPDSAEMKKALEKKLSGPNTSLLLVREGDDQFGRFFVSQEEVDLGRLYEEAVNASLAPATEGGDISLPRAGATNSGAMEEAKEEEELDIPKVVPCPVLLGSVEKVDQIWVIGRWRAEALDRLTSQLQDSAKEGLNNHLTY